MLLPVLRKKKRVSFSLPQSTSLPSLSRLSYPYILFCSSYLKLCHRKWREALIDESLFLFDLIPKLGLDAVHDVVVDEAQQTKALYEKQSVGVVDDTVRREER